MPPEIVNPPEQAGAGRLGDVAAADHRAAAERAAREEERQAAAADHGAAGDTAALHQLLRTAVFNRVAEGTAAGHDELGAVTPYRAAAVRPAVEAFTVHGRAGGEAAGQDRFHAAGTDDGAAR